MTVVVGVIWPSVDTGVQSFVLDLEGGPAIQLIAAAGIVIFGAALTWACSVNRLAHFGESPGFYRWAENLPTENPSRHIKFYGGLFAASLSIGIFSAVFGGPDIGVGPLSPFLGIGIGWIMVWAVLGFQLINPFAWAFPGFVEFGARFFHFFSILNAIFVPFVVIFDVARMGEYAMVMAVAVGSAVGSSQFLIYWLRKTETDNSLK